MASSVVSFSLENGCSFPMPSPCTMRNLRSAGMANPASSASFCGAMATVSGVRCPSASHSTARSLAFSCSEAKWPPSFCSWARKRSKMESWTSRFPSAEQPDP